MKKVIFLFEGNNDVKAILNYFNKYFITSPNVSLDDKPYIFPGVKNEFQYDVLSNSVKYQYKDITIHLATNLSDFNENDYDKIYSFQTYHRGNIYHNKNTDRYERILINIGERTALLGDYEKETNGHKLISGSNLKNDNVFYDFKFNMMYFYYYFGFNYLRFKYRKVIKDSLLGMYWFPNYKGERDERVSRIQKLSSFDIDFYSDTPDMNIYESIRTADADVWDKNHISSWTDYETSVVGYVFETLHHSTEFESIHRMEYISEKTLKPLLFSFLKMPFILDCNPYSFIDLTNDGYWFLNSEFFSYEESDNYEIIIEKFSNALDETILYLEDLYKSHNLDDISNILYEKYKDKIDTNFKKITEDVNNPKNGDLLLDFILK